MKLLADMGAYLQIITPGTPLLGMFMYSGIYKMEALNFDAHRRLHQQDADRRVLAGAGRPRRRSPSSASSTSSPPSSVWSSMELRKKNWIVEEFPYTQIAGLTYDTGNYEAATARAMELFGYDELRAEQKARRESGDKVQLGLGISMFTEMCGLLFADPRRPQYAAGGWEHCTIRALPTGKIELITGTAGTARGTRRPGARSPATSSACRVEDIEVVHGDTGRAPLGMDTYGSRLLAVGGQAIKVVGERLVEKAKLIAAHQLEVSPVDIEFSEGVYSVKGDLREAAATSPPGRSRRSPRITSRTASSPPSGEATVDPQDFSYPHGTHLAAMEVDTETGKA
ncbi:MAG: molybdopterin cofactor-binding domain-containing protein [Candidatus Nanopelagicales bacterium]